MIRAIPIAIILCVLWAFAWIAVDAAKPSAWGEWYDDGPPSVMASLDAPLCDPSVDSDCCYTEDNAQARGWYGDLDGTFSVDLPYPLCPFGNAALAVRLVTPRRFDVELYATHEGVRYDVPLVSSDRRNRYALCFPRPPYPAGMWTVTLVGPVKDAYLEVVVAPWPRIAQGWCL